MIIGWGHVRHLWSRRAERQRGCRRSGWRPWRRRAFGGADADTLDGGDGIDLASYRTSAAGVSVALDGNVGAGGDAAGDRLTNIENANGSNFDDVTLDPCSAHQPEYADPSILTDRRGYTRRRAVTISAWSCLPYDGLTARAGGHSLRRLFTRLLTPFRVAPFGRLWFSCSFSVILILDRCTHESS